MSHPYFRIAGATALVYASVTLAQAGGGRPAPAAPAPAPAQNPATPPQNPAAPPQNPATPPQNPATPPQNPATPPQNPTPPSQNPATPPQNPATPPQTPAAPPQNPATPPQNPATLPQNPATLPQNPAVPAPNPGIPVQPPTGPGQPATPVQPGAPSRPNQPVASGTPAGRLSPQAQSMLTGLNGVNVQAANVRTAAGIEANLTGGQINALIQAVGANPQTQQNATALTQQLRQRRLIGQDQQVVGYDNGRVLVATNAQVTAATRANRAAPAFTPQMNTLVTNLAGVNVQALKVQGVTNANTLFNEGQVTAIYDAISASPQARTVADRITMNLLADGLIRGNQRVIGIQDGRAIVTAPNQ
jgi:hypothetical protein